MLVMLAVIIAIHEYGHYLMMRRNGIPVEEFTIGFGPTLIQKQLKSGTWFRVKLIWLGGYAKPTDEGAQMIKDASAWARFQIYVGGMLTNATMAFLVFLVFGYATGKVPVIIIPYIKWAPNWLWPFLAAFLLSYGLWLATPFLVVGMLIKMGMAFFAQAAGPIGIFQMGHEMATRSATPAQLTSSLLLMFAMINSAIAGFNLMPLLPLDGGHLFGMLLTKLSGRHAAKAMKVFGIVSVVVFIFLVIMIFQSDISRLISGGSIIPK
jgi:regulator of sigma E protease